MITLLFTVLAIFLVGMMIPYFLSHSFMGPFFRLFAIPGVILHEFAHAGACLITGTKIHRIRLFKREGGEVAHEHSRIPIVGPLLITFAPLFIGYGALIVLAGRVLPGTEVVLGHPTLRDFPPFFWAVVRSIAWGSVATWVYLYFIFSVGSTMTPSGQDLRNSAVPLVILVVAIVAVLKVSVWHMAVDQLAFMVLPALTLALFILLSLLVVAMIIYYLSAIFGITR